MTDFLDVKRGEIRSRLDELVPAVEEYARLQAAADALGRIDGAGPTTRPAPARRGRPRKSASASRPKVATATRSAAGPRSKSG